MNRRSFFRLAVGAVATPMIPKPLLALAMPSDPLTFMGLQYCHPGLGSVGTYGGISRLSTPIYSEGTCLTLAVVRNFQRRMEVQLS